MATQVSYFCHGCRLRNRCPTCGQGLAPSCQKRHVPHQTCASCGAALCKRTRPAADGVRRLERLIDDLLRLHAVGYRMAEGRSLPDLLGSACFQFGKQRMSIARLPHRDRYHLFRQQTEGRSTPFGTRKSPATFYWKRVVQAASAWSGLVTSFSDAVLPRPKAGPCPTTADPNLADLVQAAARLDQQPQTLWKFPVRFRRARPARHHSSVQDPVGRASSPARKLRGTRLWSRRYRGHHDAARAAQFQSDRVHAAARSGPG